MADYIKRKDALKKFGKERDAFGIAKRINVQTAKNYLRQVPAADVVEVVRCKDCEHSYEDIIYVNGAVTVERCCSFGPCCDSPVDDDFFCRDSKRKEDNYD